MNDQMKKQPSVLPDPNVCRTRVLKPVALVECLVDSPQQCAYVLVYGNDFFCRHPDGRSFAKRSPTDAEPA